MDRKVKIVDVRARYMETWLVRVAPLLIEQVAYHAALDSADPDEFSESLYDPVADYSEVARVTEDFACFVAYLGDEAVGFVSAFVEGKRTSVPYDSGHIMDLYVKEEHRGEGIGSMLMETALAWFKSKETVRQVALEVWSGNEGVISLYEKYGFRVHYTNMTCPNKSWKGLQSS